MFGSSGDEPNTNSDSTSTNSSNVPQTTSIEWPDLRAHVMILVIGLVFCLPIYISELIPQSITATVIMLGWMLAAVGNLYNFARYQQKILIFNAVMAFINPCLFANILSKL
jgi:hypothetical protein